MPLKLRAASGRAKHWERTMSRRTRARSFLFEPLRFINDEAVRMMEPVALGGYAALFCQLWEQPEPGVVPDDDRLLASLARMAPETWTLARSQIARAFDTTSRPGFWLQSGMIQTAAAQDRFVASQSRAGKRSANSRWGKENDKLRTTDPQPRVTDSLSGGYGEPITPSVLGSRFSENLSPRVASLHGSPSTAVDDHAPNGHSNGNGHLTIREWFRTVFWPYYPRKVGKRAAYNRIQVLFKTAGPALEDELGNAIMNTLQDFKHGEWAAREPGLIPHAATFLNREDFLDAR
jgi:hypothetical protein